MWTVRPPTLDKIARERAWSDTPFQRNKECYYMCMVSIGFLTVKSLFFRRGSGKPVTNLCANSPLGAPFFNVCRVEVN
jgi:hypothetical protein